jgi:abequosyltransferase
VEEVRLAIDIFGNNMKEYFLTICIPTYNRSFFLKGLIENILSEIDECGLSEDVQILIVDGNSEDNTMDIIENSKNRGKLKYYRRKKKEGIDKDILKCVELSDAEYCWLFSDDDRLTTRAISHLVNTLRREENLTGCFCNRKAYDFQIEKEVAEVKDWPGKIIKEDRIFTDKAKCFNYIGMDFGFISSQVIRRSEWQKVVEKEDFGELYNSYYLMVHIISRMMDKKFKWLYISKPLIKQRTGNDSLLNSKGVIERQIIEHNSFEKIVGRHYDSKSEEYKIFFKKMVNRLPRVIANLKSQNINYKTQYRLLKLYYGKYNSYSLFWLKVIPIFFLPNIIFNLIKKMYFKYWI